MVYFLVANSGARNESIILREHAVRIRKCRGRMISVSPVGDVIIKTFLSLQRYFYDKGGSNVLLTVDFNRS